MSSLLALAVLPFLAQAPACDASLERAVAARLDQAAGPWLLRCVDDEHLELVRVVDEGSARARVVSLAGVSPDLRLEVVLLASRALLGVPREASEPPALPVIPEPVAVRRPLQPAQVELVVVPRSPTPALLRAGLFQAQPPRGPRPVVLGGARWFPLEGTWLVGGAAGVEWGPVQALARVEGATAALGTAQVRALVLEGGGSLAVACTTGVVAAGCVRVEAGVGAASLALVSSNPSVTSRAGWTVWGTAALTVGLVARVSPLWVGVSARVGGALGPRATSGGVPGPGWAGLQVGANLEAGWE